MIQNSTDEAGTEPANGFSPTDESETGTSSPNGEAVLELGEGELVIDDSRFSTDVYVSVDVENVGADHSGRVEVIVDWYNDAGEYIGNDSRYLNSLGPGEVWATRVYYLGSEGEAVNDFEVAGEYDSIAPNMEPGGIQLLESELLVSEDKAVVTGRVENERDEPISYLEATAKIYDGDGVVLGDEWTNVADIPAGEVWAFDLSWFGRERVQDASDHTVWLQE